MRYRLIGAAGLVIGAVAIGPTAWERMRFRPLSPDAIADHLLVEKSSRTLSVMRDGIPLKSYRVALGRNVDGPKEFEGDGRTPEGHYVIDSRKPDSAFHRALHISYPSIEDEVNATLHGRSPGGAIMIHGLRNGLGLLGPAHRACDWTDGCVAVTNREIEELWRVVPDGTPIEVRP